MGAFGENLKYLRKRAGYTQDKMAENLNISSSQYKNYEKGRSYPLVDKLIVLCNIFNVSADYLLRNEDRIFQDHATAAFFKEVREMDDEASKAIFYAFQKLSEYKKATELPNKK